MNTRVSGTLDATKTGQYDQLVQACLTSGASCIVDIHNYARFNGKVTGSSGRLTNDDFISLWSQLAIKYGKTSKVIFGVMDEPHDLAFIPQ